MTNFFPRWSRVLLLLLVLPFFARAQNVGIGTTTPTQKLDVDGNLRVRGLSGTDNRLPVVLSDGTLGVNAPVYSTTATVPAFPTAAAGSVATGTAPFGLAVSGTTAYVTNRGSSTLQVFNVADPAAPTLLGSVPTSNTPFSVAVSGTTAYVVSQSSTLQAFNVANPAAPVLLGSVATGSFPFAMAASGATAYVANWGSNTLQVFSVANPAAPALLGTVTTGAAPRGVAVSGTTAYVVNESGNTLQVFSVTNPAAPALLGSVATGNSPRSVAVSGTTAYVINNSGNTLQVFNVANPAAPALIGTVATGSQPGGVAVSATTAYVVNSGGNTLQAFDVSNPASPVLLGSVATGSQPGGVAVSGTTACVVNSGGNTLQAFSFPNPPRVTVVNTDGSFGSVALPGGSDFIQNQSAADQVANFRINGNGLMAGRVGIGTTGPATKLDVNGNLRLAVRLCPVNQTAYALTAADVAFSIFKLQIGKAVSNLTLPPASAGQVEGQELTIINAADIVCTVSGTNTDNSGTAVALASSSISGVHSVKYVWATYASGSGVWFRVQ